MVCRGVTSLSSSAFLTKKKNEKWSILGVYTIQPSLGRGQQLCFHTVLSTSTNAFLCVVVTAKCVVFTAGQHAVFTSESLCSPTATGLGGVGPPPRGPDPGPGVSLLCMRTAIANKRKVNQMSLRLSCLVTSKHREHRGVPKTALRQSESNNVAGEK